MTPVKLVFSFQRDVPVCVLPGDCPLVLAVRFLGLHHRVAEGWERVSGEAAHRRKRPWSEGISWWPRGEALLKKCDGTQRDEI